MNSVATVVLRPAVVALLVVTCLSGCNTSWHSQVSFSARADRVPDLESEVVTHTVALPAGGEPVRMRNIAGSITIEHGDVDEVEMEATIRAKGASDAHTAALLADMTWILSKDRHGRDEWTLDYPVERYTTFHYSQSDSGFRATSDAFGRKVSVTTQRDPGVPTLFADILITYPEGAALSCRTIAGEITGGGLSGTLTVKVTAGGVSLGDFEGELDVDTGCGDIAINSADGKIHLDTGSGDIEVTTLAGSAHLDTGSGDIVIGTMDATTHADTGSGSIRVAAVNAPGYFDTGSGDITIEDGRASNVHADTGSGDIWIGGGSIDEIVLDTGSGRIEILDVSFVRFNADTGSGDITVRSPLSEARHVEADTGSGDVMIMTGADASFDLTTSLSSGRLHVRFDDARLEYDGRRVIGATRGDGRTSIHVDTGSGDCTVRPM